MRAREFVQQRRSALRRIGVAGLLCWLTIAGSSCNSPELSSPTLPLPPPEIGRDGERYVLSGTVPSQRANVFARNERTLRIFGEYTTSRSYEFPVDAAPGDYFTMWYAIELQQSPPILVEIPDDITAVESLGVASDAGTPDSGE